MEKLVNDIVSYVEFLKEKQQLAVTIHDQFGFLGRFGKSFVTYNIHSNPYCIYLKTNGEIWKHCITRQHKIKKKCQEGSFFGMCYCGVGEYVIPIKSEEQILGFISVSGYKTNREEAVKKIRYVTEQYGLNYDATIREYDKHLNDQIPTEEEIHTVIMPLASMLELLFMKEKQIYGTVNEKVNDEDYILGHILVYLSTKIREKVTIEELCESCHCSRSYISHLFKKKMGVGIPTYINTLRMKEAQKLLKFTTLSIQDIAYKVGFTDSNYFSTVFTNYIGETPSKYRNEKR